MSQRLIDIGGYRLGLRVSGQGSPAVICLASAGGAHQEWAEVVPAVAATTTVVTYGRPVLGGSDPLPLELRGLRVGGEWVARQLRTLLTTAGIEPPYVLATGSIGAWIADQYAALWPDDIAGLMLVDPSPVSEFQGVVDGWGDITEGDEPGGLCLSWQVGHADQQTRAPENRAGRFVVVSGAPGYWLRGSPVAWHQPLTRAEVDAQWVVMQREWAQRLAAPQVVAAHAGHHVYREQPELVAAVVQEIVDAARAGRPVAFTATRLGAVGGRLADIEEVRRGDWRR